VTRRSLAVAAVLLAAAAALLLPRLLRRAPTDEEQIRALLEAAAAAAEEKRVGDAVEGLSERFEGHGLDRQGARRLVTFHVLRGSWVAVKLAGAKVLVQGDGALAVADVAMLRSGEGEELSRLLPERATLHRFDLRLAREEDGWKVTRARWRPVTPGEAAAGPELPADAGW
jgi:hypothetical protein